MTDRSWFDIIGKFNDKADEFKIAFIKLKNTKAPTASLQRDKRRLLAVGEAVAKKIAAITGAVDDAFNYTKNALGFDGFDDDGLGILPAIPIAVAIAAVAAMTKFITDTYIYIDKANKFETLRKRVGDKQAAVIIAKLDTRPPMMGNIFAAVGPMLLLGGVWYYMRGK